MRIKCIFISIVFALTLTNCVSFNFSRRIVQQGNLLSPEKLERLKTGISKEDAAILMGSSLISPTFNHDRWDYAYTWRKWGGPLETRHLSLYFSHGRLARIEHQT